MAVICPEFTNVELARRKRPAVAVMAPEFVMVCALRYREAVFLLTVIAPWLTSVPQRIPWTPLAALSTMLSFEPSVSW